MMVYLLKQYWSDEHGATAVEYGLIVAGIAVAIIATVLAIGGDLDATFQSIRDDFTG